MAAARRTTNPTAAEALAVDIPFTFAGHDYAVLPSSEWTIDALENFENGRILAFTREVLVGDSFAEFRSRHNKVTELNDFMVSIQKAVGVSGN